MANLPRTLGRYGYEVVAALGHGGMGTVYRARDPRLGRELAIKLLREGYDSTDSRDRFLREARSAGSLSHPNIVTIYDIGEHEGRPFIAMEYVPGENFAELIRSQAPLPLALKLQMIEEVCQGLSHAHESGVVHRDIKPANLMVGPGGTVKILDFGLARLLQASGMTKPGDILGTLNYMSPEQIKGGAVDRRADIFGVGAVLYELLSGRQAFPGKAPGVVFQQILNGVPVPLAQHCPDIDPRLTEIVDHALQKDPARRFQTVELLQEELETVRWSLPEIVPPETIAEAAPDDEQTVMTARTEEATRGILRPPRAEQIESHLAAAVRAYAEGDYDSALKSCEQVLLLDPSESRAAVQLERVHTAIDERKIQTSLAEARRHLSQGAIAAASELVESATARSPHHPDLASIRTEIDNEKARVRSEAVRAANGRARSAFAAGDLTTALLCTNQALALDPASEIARNLKGEIENAVAARKEDARIRAAIDEARRRFKNGEHDAALGVLEAEPASNPVVAHALEELRSARQAIEQRQIQTSLAEARRHLSQGAIAAASELVESVSARSPHHPDLASIRTEIDNEKARVRSEAVRAANGRARSAFAAGDLTTALLCANQALGLDPASEIARNLKGEIENAVAARKEDARIRAAIDEARRRFKNGEHDAALGVLEAEPASNPLVAHALEELRSARQAIEQRQVQTSLAEARRHLSQGAIAAASELVESVSARSPHHPDLASIRIEIDNEKARVRSEAIHAANGRARSAFAAGDLTTALTCTNQALALDPANEIARNLKGEIENAVAARKEDARIRAAIDEARRRFKNGEHDAALGVLEAEPASNPLVADALEELRSARQAIEEQQRETQERQERQQRVAALIADARGALQGRQFDAALDALDRARQIDPTVPEVAKLAERVRQEQTAVQVEMDLARALADLDERLSADDLSGAEAHLRTATALGETDARVRAAHKRLEQATKERAAREAAAARQRESENKTAEAADLVQRGDFAGAQRLLKSAAALHPENPRVALVAAQLHDAIEKQTAAEAAERVRQQVGELVRAAAAPLQSGNDQPAALMKALSCIDEALALDPANAEALNLKPALEKALESSREQARLRAAISNARRRFANGKHQAAFQLLETLQPSSHPLVVEALSELRAAQQEIERQRQTEQLLSKARTALQARQFAEALDALSRAREIDATVGGLSELTEQARAGQAAAAARTRESEQITAEAVRLFDNGDLARAAQLASRAVDLDPENVRAGTLAAQVREAIEQHAAAEAAERLRRRKEIETLLASASQRLQSSDLAGAGELIESILHQEPTHAGAQQLKGTLDKAIRTAQKEAARRQQRIDTGLASAAKNAQRLKFPQAVHELEEVLQLEPQHERATQLLAEVRDAEQRHQIAQKVDALLKQAADTDSHEHALGFLQKALALDPASEAARNLKGEIEKAEAARKEDARIRAAVDEARRRFKNGEHDAALVVLEAEPASNPVVAHALEELRIARRAIEQQQREAQERQERQQRVAALIVDARGALHGQQFDAALDALDRARQIDPTVPEVAELAERVRQEQTAAQVERDLARTLAELDERLSADDLRGAEQLLRAATALGETDARVRAAHQRLEQATKERAAREAAAARERKSEGQTADAADLVQRGDFDGAQRLLKSAAELHPANPRIALVTAELYDAIERQTAAEAERVRQQVEELVRSAAQPAQSADAQPAELMLALSRIDEALALDPANDEALALRPAIESALESSREQARLRAEIGNARRRFANGKHRAALQLLESLQPSSHPLVVEALTELRSAHQRIEHEQRIDDRLAAAARHAQRLQFPEAVHDLEEVLELEPQHERATQLLAEVRDAERRHRVAQEVDDLLTQAAEADSHERAFAFLQQAQKIAPNDRRVLEMLFSRKAAENPDIGEMTIDLSALRTRPGPAPARLPPQPPKPKPGAREIFANRQFVLIVGSALVVALAILGIRFWPSREATEGTQTGPGAGPAGGTAAPAATPVQTFPLLISGTYPFEVEFQGAILPASTTHSIKLPAGVINQVRLRSPEVFLNISAAVRGDADQSTTLRAPALSSVTVYNSYNQSCEILIDGRPLGHDAVTQALVSGGHDVSLKCPQGRAPGPKHIEVPATKPAQVTFTKDD